MRIPSSFWSTGFSMRPACGDPAIERLEADRYRCIAIDLPEMGRGLTKRGLMTLPG